MVAVACSEVFQGRVGGKQQRHGALEPAPRDEDAFGGWSGRKRTRHAAGDKRSHGEDGNEGENDTLPEVQSI